MSNIAYIYQPHFNSNCFRVAISKQQGTTTNYIVVTCSPNYNGVWKYSSSNLYDYPSWNNGNVVCKCVPISDCEFVKHLNQLKNEDILKQVKKQQLTWFNNQVKNRNYDYVTKPDWLIF